MVGMTGTTDRTGAGERQREPYEGSPEESRGKPPGGPYAGPVRRCFTVHHDGVTLPVSRGGRGRPLVLCPGLCSTQAELHELIGLLRRDHDVVTFDHRGHGFSSPGDRYTFDAFLGDFTAVMAQVARLDLPEPPLLVGYSLGADLALHYTGDHPEAVGGLVLIDGANPVPEPFITEEFLAEFRAMARETQRELDLTKGTDRQVLLTGQDVLDLQIEMDVVRAAILERYARIEHPITMVMSTALAGPATEGPAARHNQLWRAGIDRLLDARPATATTWFDADHRLVITHAGRIAEIVRFGVAGEG